MKYFLLFFLISVTSFAQSSKEKFLGNVTVQWLDDGRSMKLLKEFGYIDPNGKKWNVPKNIIVDGASIPQLFWTLIGGPYEGSYRNASVVHDHFCVTKTESWQDVHLMFYNACITGGTKELKAKSMYAVVYAAGPRWESYILKDAKGTKVTVEKEAVVSNDKLKEVSDWIENTNPSLEEINARLDNIVIETDKK